MSTPLPSVTTIKGLVPRTDLKGFYEEGKVFNSGFLQVSELHNIWYEEAGNKSGLPIIILHGGPGGGLAGFYNQFCNPEKYRIVQFDQRGSGKSTPSGELRDNTTWHLVDDIEKLRQHLGIERWVVFGGSWGSTLSLTYAVQHPERVLGLVLRGIFLVRPREIEYFYQTGGGADAVFPDLWESFVEPIPLAERRHLLSAFHRRLTDETFSAEERLAAAKAWSCWEMATSRLYVDPEYIKRAADDAEFALKFARIETHYFSHGAFFPHDGLVTAVLLSFLICFSRLAVGEGADRSHQEHSDYDCAGTV